MSLTADAANFKTGYRSSADACGRGRYFWRKRNYLHLHISHLRWWASITTTATMSLFHYYAYFVITLFSLGSHHERYNEVAVYLIFAIFSWINRSLLLVIFQTVVFLLFSGWIWNGSTSQCGSGKPSSVRMLESWSGWRCFIVITVFWCIVFTCGGAGVRSYWSTHTARFVSLNAQHVLLDSQLLSGMVVKSGVYLTTVCIL